MLGFMATKSIEIVSYDFSDRRRISAHWGALCDLKKEGEDEG